MWGRCQIVWERGVERCEGVGKCERVWRGVR